MKQAMRRADSVHAGVRAVAALSLLSLGAMVVWSIVELPDEARGLVPLVHERLGQAGAENPVTAVLLNFRAYDTLLEIVVLTLALTAVWSLRAPSRRLGSRPGAALTAVVSLLTPLIIIVGGFVLWQGTSQPGGAFQAGAIIASAGVLLLLVEMPAVRTQRQWFVRLGGALGAVVFVSIGLGCVVVGRNFLEYPNSWAKPLIIVIESVSTVSIALILAGLFAGSPRALTLGIDSRHEGE